MKKCNVEYECEYGILTKNPDQVEQFDFKHHRKLVWIKYERIWYLSKRNDLDKEATIHYINDSYNQWQVIDKILQLI